MCITHRMLPTSDTNRYIQVGAGSAHVRILKKTVDEMDVPIVERMTLKKLGKMTARQVKLWEGCRQALAGRVPRVNHRAFSRENMSCGDTLSVCSTHSVSDVTSLCLCLPVF